MVPFGFRIACRRASWPTRRSPWGVKATTDGVVRAPSAFGITVGLPASLTAITELVVPRSIPTAFAIVASSPVTAPRRGRSAAIDEQRRACTARHAERLARGEHAQIASYVGRYRAITRPGVSAPGGPFRGRS